MEIKTIKQYYFPLNFSVADMQPNILLMCKLLFILLCAHGFLSYIEDPYIPFIKTFDLFLSYPNIFKITFKTLFLFSGLSLLFNFKPRAMSIILGSSLFIILLASKSLFRNHLFICACAFLLAGLSNKNEFPWLLYFQLSLVYFGAVLNKVVQIDWWNGQFIYNWLVNARENQLFIKVSDVFPEMWLAKILSWSSMLIEFSISIFILVKKRHFLVAWVIILFHTILYTMTAFRFGHFYEDIVIILLIFINWPSGIIQISSKNVISPFVRKSFNFFNFSKKFHLINNVLSNKNWLEIKIEDKTVSNWHAFRLFLLYSTNFYIFLFLLDLLVRFMFNGFLMNFIHISLTWLCILFFIPLLFGKKIKKNVV
jgi:hypothetical protein